MKKTVFILCALIFVGCSDQKRDELKKEPYQEVKKVTTTTKEETKPKALKDTKGGQIAKNIETAAVVVNTKSGKEVYHACAACHGQNAQKKALGKSKIIRGWDASKTLAALNGYKDDSYGGALKGLMKAQASALSKDEIKAVSEYISRL